MLQSHKKKNEGKIHKEKGKKMKRVKPKLKPQPKHMVLLSSSVFAFISSLSSTISLLVVLLFSLDDCLVSLLRRT